jgi:SAM-dependent methyltransferase
MSLVICCPACGFHPVQDTECRGCGFRTEQIDDILDLRTDKSYDTLLDTESYDAYHGIEGEADEGVFATYRSLMEQIGIRPQGDVLEIACGSGKLTASMLATGCFASIHCGDISPEFMRIMARRIGGIKTPTCVEKYLFDANRLPFVDQSFDFVFGNSVLHHLAEFEKTIEDAFRVLKPGGAAMFGEPLFDSHAMVSLAAGLIARSPNALEIEGMTSQHLMALKTIQNRLGRKLDALYGDRTALRDVEDKFIFPAKLLRDLGDTIGYSRVVISGAGPKFKLGSAAKTRIYRIVERVGLSTRPLDAFSHVFDALNTDYGVPMQDFIHPVFAHIAFIR